MAAAGGQHGWRLLLRENGSSINVTMAAVSYVSYESIGGINENE